VSDAQLLSLLEKVNEQSAPKATTVCGQHSSRLFLPHVAGPDKPPQTFPV
jgi:hypothetical protein